MTDPEDRTPADPGARPTGGPAEEPDGTASRVAPADLVRQVLTGTQGVAELVARAAVLAHGRAAREHRDRVWAAGTPVQDEIDRTIRHHTGLARAQGAAAGATLTAIETTSLWGSAGTLTVPAALTGLAGDLTSLAWIQARMAMHLAALHGLDPLDADARLRDLLQLWGIESLDDVVQGSTALWGRRVLGRVTGPVARLRTLLHLVGLRSMTRRLVPLANVPLTAAANAKATAALGQDAVRFFADHPSLRD